MEEAEKVSVMETEVKQRANSRAAAGRRTLRCVNVRSLRPRVSSQDASEAPIFVHNLLTSGILQQTGILTAVFQPVALLMLEIH